MSADDKMEDEAMDEEDETCNNLELKIIENQEMMEETEERLENDGKNQEMMQETGGEDENESSGSPDLGKGEIQDKGKEVAVCPNCSIRSDQRGMNKRNWARHLEGCDKTHKAKEEKADKKIQKKQEKKQEKIDLKRKNWKNTHGSYTLQRFFSKKSCNSTTQNVSNNVNFTNPGPSSSAGGETSSYIDFTCDRLTSATTTTSTNDKTVEVPETNNVDENLISDLVEETSTNDRTVEVPETNNVDADLISNLGEETSTNDKPVEVPETNNVDADLLSDLGEEDTNTIDLDSDSMISSVPRNVTPNVVIREKCKGYQVKMMDIYSELPCHILEGEMSIIIENRNFHHTDCAANDYALDPDRNETNKMCEDISYSTKVKKLENRGKMQYKTDTPLRTTNNKYLSHRQLCDKAEILQAEKRELRLQFMKSEYLRSKLCATLTLHQRFLVLMSDHNIPRLQQLVRVALNNDASIGTIVSKVMDAIDGIYKANPTQDDKDLAFITLKFGGPSLLNILYRAGLLPSVSTAYRISRDCPPILSCVQHSIGECFDANIKLSVIGQSSMSLKIDETFVTPTLGYNSKDNKAYGVCHTHGRDINLELENFSDCEKIESLVEDGELHVPKECTVAALDALNEDCALQPLLMWPRCSKKDRDETVELIQAVCSEMKKRTGYGLMNVTTDGDPTRRQAFEHIRTEDADQFDWFDLVSDLPLMDYTVGPDGTTVNFDPKHMAKRTWRMILSEKMQINGVMITKKLLAEFLEGNSHGVGEEQLHPKDKQNVDAATKFLLAFIEASQKEDLPYNFLPIKQELKLLGQIIKGLLSFYVYVEMNISEQLSTMSCAAYLLLYMYRRDNRDKLMPSQLYHDLMASWIDVLFCAAKTKEYTPEEPLYVVKDANDPLERYFGNVRLRFKNCNFNVLEMINAARAINKCDEILMIDHPDWSKKNRTQRRLALDYSSVSNWDKEKSVLKDLNLSNTWYTGFFTAMGMIPSDAAASLRSRNGITLKCPLVPGKVVGVSTYDEPEDWSMAEEAQEGSSDTEDLSMTTAPEEEQEQVISEMIQDASQKIEPFFLIDGKRVYKSTCLKDISSKNKLSKDRLRKVRGMTYCPAEKQSTPTHNDSLLLIGDPLLYAHSTDGPILGNIVAMKKNNISLNELDSSKGLGNIEFSIRTIEGEEIEGKFFCKGVTEKEIIRCPGVDCFPIKPMVDLNPPPGMTKFYFESNLLLDMCVHLQVQPSETSTSSSTTATNGAQKTSVIEKSCYKCRKKVPLSDMRLHVGMHILKEDIVDINTCGFCGRNVCSVKLKGTRGRSQMFYKIQDCDCPFYYDYGKTKKFNKKSNPCTNRFLPCPIEGCLSEVWMYNFRQHFEVKHSDMDEESFPEVMKISEQEEDCVLGSTTKKK